MKTPTLTKSQIKKLEILGYHLIKNSNPVKFAGGGQFAGNIWEISESQALERLEHAENMNQVWLKRFGKKLYKI